MTYDKFAQALMHRPQSCSFEWSPQNIGKRRESKTVDVPFTLTYEPDDLNKQKAAATLKPFETDGWVGHPEDLLNHRNRVKGEVEAYRVHFTRYV